MDFAALTAAVGAGLADVRACLIVSRDGLALASYPPAEEGSAMAKWARLTSLGDVERGFAVVGEECWVFCNRGPYSALAVARASARPGVILERLDQMVLAAEESRLRKEGIGLDDPRDPTAAARRRRTPLTGVHPGQAPQLPSPSDRPAPRMTGGSGVPAQGPAPLGQGAAPIRQGTFPAARGVGQPPASSPRLGAEQQERRDGGTSAEPPLPPGRGGPAASRPDPRPPDALGEGPSDAAAQGEEEDKASQQRSLWVMDVDDLSREFAGLLDPKDREGQ